MTTPTHLATTVHDGKDHPMTPTETATSDAVRAAMVELLTSGQYHHAATRTTVGQTRAALDQRHGTADSTARHAPPDRGLAALTAALGVVDSPVFAATPRHHP